MKELKVGERVTIECVRTTLSKPFICNKCFFYYMLPNCRKYCIATILKDKQKYQPKEQHEFTIKGVKIMAASKKDAIKKYNHRKK